MSDQLEELRAKERKCQAAGVGDPDRAWLIDAVDEARADVERLTTAAADHFLPTIERLERERDEAEAEAEFHLSMWGTLGVLRAAQAEVERLTSERVSIVAVCDKALEKGERELFDARRSASAMHRRAQAAEAIVAKRIDEIRALGDWSFGRALANCAAAMYEARAVKAEAAIVEALMEVPRIQSAIEELAEERVSQEREVVRLEGQLALAKAWGRELFNDWVCAQPLVEVLTEQRNEARACCRRAAQIVREVIGSDRPEVAGLLHALGPVSKEPSR